MSRATGFVLWWRHDRPSQPCELFELRTEAEAGALRTRNSGLFSRPLRATPEAQTEDQPVVTDGTLLVYTGRVADRSRVAHRLDRPELATAPDGTVLAAAYELWGVDFPHHVEGEYAFAMIDRRSGRVIAGRDALGLKKVFWYRNGSRTWVASNLELLLTFLPEGGRLDPLGVRELIAANLLAGATEATIYEGVRYLPPAHVYQFRGAENPRRHRYWHPENLPEWRQIDGPTSDELLRQRLFDAVGQALRAHGPVVAELSGGLDSSSVVGAAARLCHATHITASLRALTFVSTDPDWDDPAHPRAICELHGLENETFDADHEPESDDLVGTAQPSLAALQCWNLRGHRWAAKHLGARVCLNGQGGDALFLKGGAPRFVADLWQQRQWRLWFRALREWPDGRHGSLWSLLRFSAARRFPQSATTPSWLRGVETVEPSRAFRRRYALPARQRQFETIAALSATLPDESDRGLEPRSPLLARPMVELVLRLPWHHLLRPEEDRVIQRRALQGLVPQTILLRRDKADFTAHVVRTLRSLDRQGARTGGYRWLDELGLIEHSAFTAAVNRFLHGLSTEAMMHVSSALAVEAWLIANDGPPTYPLRDAGELATWAAGHNRNPGITCNTSPGEPHERLDPSPRRRHRQALAGPRPSA